MAWECNTSRAILAQTKLWSYKVYWPLSSQGEVKCFFASWMTKKLFALLWCSTTIQVNFCKEASRKQTVELDKNPAEVVLYPRLCFIQGHCLIELIGRLNYYLRRLERVFRCWSACETMEDYKKRMFNGVGQLYVSWQFYYWAIL